jgi:ABC-2 type transport system permease protein
MSARDGDRGGNGGEAAIGATASAGSSAGSTVATGPAVGTMTAIRLVAARELTTRLHSKAFRVMTAVVLVVIVGTILAFHLLPGLGSSVSKIGVLQSEATLAQRIAATAPVVGATVEPVTVSNAEAGRAQVADGDLDALVLSGAGGQLTVVVKSELSAGDRAALTLVARNMVQDNAIRNLGGDPAAVNAAVAGADITVDSIKPPKKYNVQQLVLGGAAGILIYLSLMIGGQLVAQGVVEEKSSRVVELLLAAVRPWELMVGKVLGIGALGLIQIALYGLIGVGLASALGTLTLSLSAAAGTIIWLVVWYLVGFVMYAFAFAAAGALVSRQEDAAGVIMPVTSFVIVGYVIGISVLPNNPASPFAEVMSVIPLFAPTLMPMRLAMGGVPAWEAALALVLALAMIPALAALAGRIYRNAVMHIGARVSLRKALARV